MTGHDPLARPYSCDTFVAMPDITDDGATLLGKNSDRPAGECQPLRYWPRRRSAPSARLRLAYLDIADVEQSWAHLGASPYWCWGHELGLNEWGVAIGNEALFTRDLASTMARAKRGDPTAPGLIGMELVRLALERGKTAQQALNVITALLEQHGQWASGVAGQPVEDGGYDNSYLIADANQALVLETSGRQWVARSVTSGSYSISNQPTIRAEWDRASGQLVEHALREGWCAQATASPFDFARTYVDPRTPLQASHVRLQRSRQLLSDATDNNGTVGKPQAAAVLRDHYEGSFLRGPNFSAGLPDLLTLCMHESPAGFTWGNTASSAICRMPEGADRLPHMWWAAVTPCTSVYLPVFPAAQAVPVALATPAGLPARRPDVVAAAEPSEGSYWWRFQRLLDMVTGGERALAFNRRQPQVRAAFDPLEQRWEAELPEIEREAAAMLAAGDEDGRRVLGEFTERCAKQALDTCTTLINEFAED